MWGVTNRIKCVSHTPVVINRPTYKSDQIQGRSDQVRSRGVGGKSNINSLCKNNVVININQILLLMLLAFYWEDGYKWGLKTPHLLLIILLAICWENGDR